MAMVQKEVGERFAAAPGSPAYGIPSVLAQLACDVKVIRPVSRNVFFPVPNVDSVLVRLLRTGGPAPSSRRCARSSSRASPTAARRSRAPSRSRAATATRVRAALEALGLPADARAETLAPGAVARAAREARMRLRCLAPGKVNLCLYVGAPRADGLHPLVSVVQPVSLADELTLEPARAARPPTRSSARASRATNLAGAALAAFRAATGWDAPPQRLTIAKRVPVAAGMGGGSGDAAAALRLAAHAAGGADPALLLRLAAALGGDVPSQVAPGPHADDRRGRARAPARPIRAASRS